jgi:hypothetical protein
LRRFEREGVQLLFSSGLRARAASAFVLKTFLEALRFTLSTRARLALALELCRALRQALAAKEVKGAVVEACTNEIGVGTGGVRVGGQSVSAGKCGIAL